jgi:hypothetical protein
MLRNGKGKRRANREGSIWQRHDGRWTGAAYVLTTAGTFKRAYVYGRTRDEAHAKPGPAARVISPGHPLAYHPWKVGEYLDYWLADVARAAVRPTTQAKYEFIVRLYLPPGLGRHRLGRLSVQSVQSFFNARQYVDRLPERRARGQARMATPCWHGWTR